MKRYFLLWEILSLVLLISCKKNITESNELQADRPANVQSNFVPNELLVKYKRGVSENGRSQALSRVGGNVAEQILTKAMQRIGDNDGVYLVHTPLSVLEAITKIKGGAEVEYAEPNYVYTYG